MEGKERLNFNSSPNNVKVNKSDRMKRKGHIAREKFRQNFSRKCERQLGELDVDKMLKWILNTRIMQNCGGGDGLF
jgi:hypothetical protein